MLGTPFGQLANVSGPAHHCGESLSSHDEVTVRSSVRRCLARARRRESSRHVEVGE